MDSVVLVARKYIERNRIHDTEDGSKRIIELGAKIDIEDSIDIQDHNITFSKYERPLTVTEATHAMAKELTSTIQDTGQYIQDVKTHIGKQMSTINKIKAQKEKFDREVELLQFVNQQPKTNSSIEEMNKIRDELLRRKNLKRQILHD